MKKLLALYDEFERFLEKINYQKLYSYFILLAYIGLLAPLFWASFHNTIFLDDCYAHALEVHRAWRQEPNIVGFLMAIRAAFQRMIFIYNNWGGNYTSFFFSAFQPMAFSERLNFVGTFIFLGCFLIAEYGFTNEIMCNYFRISKRTSIISYCVISIMATQWLTSIEEGFFWYSGCVTNALGFAATLELLRLLLKENRELHMRKRTLLWGGFLAVFIGGCNYSTMMSLFVILFLYMIYFISRKDVSNSEKIKVIVICILVYMGGIISITAPGNTIRRGVNEGTTAVNAIRMAILCGKDTIIQYSDYKILLYSIAIFPFVWNSLNEKKTYRLPLLVVLLTCGLFCAAFTPTMLSDSNWGPRRTRNLYWWMYLNLYTIDFVYVLGWCKHVITEYFQGKAFQFSRRACAYFFIILVMLMVGLTKAEDIKRMPSVITYFEIIRGQYKVYDEQIAERRTILYSGEKDVIVKHMDYLPYVIFTTDDISFNEIGEVSSSEYYEKDSITVVE